MTEIDRAKEAILNGDLVVFPTETVYGLGADAKSDEAVLKIFKAKGRPADNPLIVHIGNIEQINTVAKNIPAWAMELGRQVWPGPLTLVLPVKDNISKYVTAGLDTVGIRIPNHPVALEFLNSHNCPVAAPSANKSGRPSPTSLNHVKDDLGESKEIGAWLDGGECQVGIESTVLKVEENQGIILRPGIISLEDLQSMTNVPILNFDKKGDLKKVASPGMKYRHYAPSIPVFLTENFSNDDLSDGDNLCLVTNDIDAKNFNLTKVTEQNLFKLFREAEKKQKKKILILNSEELLSKAGLWNRIEKAISS